MKIENKQFRYFLSSFFGIIFGFILANIFIWIDLQELGLKLTIDNFVDILRSQNIYPVSFVMFPILFGIIGLFYSRLVSKQKMIIEQEKEIERGGRFVSIVKLAEGIGHEFNNPLTIILGQVYLYRELNRKQENDICFKRLAIIENEAKKLSNITEKFIALSRSSSFFNYSEVDLNVLTDEISKLKSEEIRVMNIDFLTQIENSDSFVWVDVKGIYEVISELLGNAIFYTRKVKQPKILIKVSVTNNNLVIDVSDNGDGVNSSIRNLIFDPLFSTKEDNQGPGLGLFVALKIAESMNGSLRYLDNNGGATFQLRVPSHQ